MKLSKRRENGAECYEYRKQERERKKTQEYYSKTSKSA